MTGVAIRALALTYGVPEDELDLVLADLQKLDPWFETMKPQHVLTALVLWACGAMVRTRERQATLQRQVALQEIAARREAAEKR